jgi:hypothetical protein
VYIFFFVGSRRLTPNIISIFRWVIFNRRKYKLAKSSIPKQTSNGLFVGPPTSTNDRLLG